MRLKFLPVLFACSIVAACAQKPEAIAAVPVAGDPYRGFSCAKLKQEHLKTSQDLETASAQQTKAANNDALGVILLGLPVSSMSGNDKEAQIAIGKGRIQEIDRKLAKKGC